MNLRRVLFGRPSGAGRAGANPPPVQAPFESAPIESAKPAPEVSAPQVSAPRTQIPDEAVADKGAGPETEISPLRLDDALKRLREENPAPSEETPSEPSE